MKILHTADWHLDKRLYGIARLEEQAQVLEEIIMIADAEEVDVVLVAGDVFDTFNPGNDAVRLFYNTLKRLTREGQTAVVVIAGNHDSPERVEVATQLAYEYGIVLAGYPFTTPPSFDLSTGLRTLRQDRGFLEIQLPAYDYPLRLLLSPYPNEARIREYLGNQMREQVLSERIENHWYDLAERYCDTQGVNLLVAHLFMAERDSPEPEEAEEEENPIRYLGGSQLFFADQVPPQIQYAALGHIHRTQVLSFSPCPVAYSGSLLPYSFTDDSLLKHVYVVEVAPGQALRTKKDIRAVSYKVPRPLMRYRAAGVANALEWLQVHQEAWVELTILTDTYLTAQERQALAEAHPRILSLIPEMRNLDSWDIDSRPTIDLNRDIRSLFADYFESRKGTRPNEELLKLFEEVLGRRG
jgi:exonuclease SbcD